MRRFEITFRVGPGARITWTRFYVADIGNAAENHRAAIEAVLREYPSATILLIEPRSDLTH
jgi:hypothetical protein